MSIRNWCPRNLLKATNGSDSFRFIIFFYIIFILFAIYVYQKYCEAFKFFISFICCVLKVTFILYHPG